MAFASTRTDGQIWSRMEYGLGAGKQALKQPGFMANIMYMGMCQN